MRRRLMEWLVAVTVVAAAIILTWHSHALDELLVKERELISQLQNIRLSLLLYRYLNGRYPNDLKTLSQERYSISGTKKSIGYLEGMSLKDGLPVSPFGEPYVYQAEFGTVYSPGRYKGW